MKVSPSLSFALGVCVIAVALTWSKFSELFERLRSGSKQEVFILVDARPCPPFSALVRSNVVRLAGNSSHAIVLSHHRLYPPLDAELNILTLLADATRFVGEKETSGRTLPLSGFAFSESAMYAIISACSSAGMMDLAVELSRNLTIPANHLAGVLVVGNAGKMACYQLNIDYLRWTASEKPVPCFSEDEANGVHLVRGDFIFVISGKLLGFLKSVDPDYRGPLAENLFFRLRASAEHSSGNISILLRESNGDKLDDLAVKYESATRKELYRNLGIKRLYTNNGSVSAYMSVDECSKESHRCFPTIVHDMPDYLFRDRWTPPCCLDNLRKTLRHVLQVLNLYKVRHWLEGGSLLGAVRYKDIIPWDSDVDLGIYETDMKLCPMFSAANASHSGGVVDSEGFLWEKAAEGDFFRVHFSVTNRLHVDIFPFRVNGSGFMTKDTWFDDHPQDCPFPEEFVLFRTEMQLGGVKVSGPRDPVEFLEYKFGKGVLENPQYPRPDLLRYP